MGRKNPPRRGIRPKTQIPTLPEGYNPPSAPLDELARARQRHPSTGQYSSTTEEIEELYQLKTDLKALIIEAHGVLKDLRIESKKAQRVIPMIVTRRIDKEVTRQLTILGEATQRAMEDSVAKVGKEFDKLEAVFLGTDRATRNAGRPSIPTMIERIGNIRDVEQKLLDEDESGALKGLSKMIVDIDERYGPE